MCDSMPTISGLRFVRAEMRMLLMTFSERSRRSSSGGARYPENLCHNPSSEDSLVSSVMESSFSFRVSQNPFHCLPSRNHDCWRVPRQEADERAGTGRLNRVAIYEIRLRFMIAGQTSDSRCWASTPRWRCSSARLPDAGYLTGIVTAASPTTRSDWSCHCRTHGREHPHPATQRGFACGGKDEGHAAF